MCTEFTAGNRIFQRLKVPLKNQQSNNSRRLRENSLLNPDKSSNQSRRLHICTPHSHLTVHLETPRLATYLVPSKKYVRHPEIIWHLIACELAASIHENFHLDLVLREPVLESDRGRPIPDHHAHRLRRGGRDMRRNRGICHPQPGNAVHSAKTA